MNFAFLILGLRVHGFLVQERLDEAEIETCYELGESLQLSTQYDHVSVHVRLPLARRWRRSESGTFHAQNGTMRRGNER